MQLKVIKAAENTQRQQMTADDFTETKLKD